MELLPADYALCGLTLVLAVTGLFRGFSGTLAFVLATASAVFAGMFGWAYSASFTPELWMRAAGTAVGTLLVFGLVRLLVKKFVNGLLAQPSDAVFGMAIGALCGAVVLVAWAYSGLYPEYSNLVRVVAPYVR